MKWASLLILVATLFMSAGPGMTIGADEDTDLQRMQGTWAVASAEVGGKPDNKRWPQVQMIVEKDKITLKIKSAKEDQILQFKLDPGQKPKAIDLLTKKNE